MRFIPLIRIIYYNTSWYFQTICIKENYNVTHASLTTIPYKAVATEPAMAPQLEGS